MTATGPTGRSANDVQAKTRAPPEGHLPLAGKLPISQIGAPMLLQTLRRAGRENSRTRR